VYLQYGLDLYFPEYAFHDIRVGLRPGSGAFQGFKLSDDEAAGEAGRPGLGTVDRRMRAREDDSPLIDQGLEVFEMTGPYARA
jgi:hypothetical protein